MQGNDLGPISFSHTQIPKDCDGPFDGGVASEWECKEVSLKECLLWYCVHPVVAWKLLWVKETYITGAKAMEFPLISYRETTSTP